MLGRVAHSQNGTILRMTEVITGRPPLTFKRSPRGISYSARTAFFLTLILTTAMLLFTQGAAHSRTWYIKADGTGDAPTIQAGVDSAAVGDTVLVGAGTYTDTSHVHIGGELRAVNVWFDKDIYVMAEFQNASTVIDATNSDVAVFVVGVGSNASVVGFRVISDGEGAGCFHPALAPSKPSLIFTVGVRCEDSTPRISRE